MADRFCKGCATPLLVTTFESSRNVVSQLDISSIKHEFSRGLELPYLQGFLLWVNVRATPRVNRHAVTLLRALV